MFKALDKTNPDVFPLIIRRFAKDFYEHQDYETLDGWVVLACDGTKMDLPPSQEMKEKFGGCLNQTITDESKVRKPQANCSILIDVLNHVVLDALIKPCKMLDGELRETQTADYFSKHRRSDCAVRELTAR